ncbi:heavy-metal-associated domain-containing protein [Curtobacterium sp. BRB10]|uniref:heavy-metal-associated domain-containing protein n=1 Tax=Curtobacterium sp. BRB10 TaxID=2962579 RepID=UPI0028817327|nr:heavy-metal-associated domain-containing protein [Curtobacterium sp. BRB10]MDT0235254.1 heavy-metal-associated domain-containing protein [Curtobacterium sp. BRB10]
MQLGQLHCDSCAQLVEDVLEDLPDVHAVRLDRTSGELALSSSTTIEASDVAAWLSDIGIRSGVGEGS